MAKQFEDLQVWQKARELTRIIYDLTTDRRFAGDFGLSDQIRRAAVSVMSNIAEGFERETRADLARFLDIAKGSCGEVRSQLYVAFDRAYISSETFVQSSNRAAEVSRMLKGLTKALRRR